MGDLNRVCMRIKEMVVVGRRRSLAIAKNTEMDTRR